jgi:hypothetical protein
VGLTSIPPSPEPPSGTLRLCRSRYCRYHLFARLRQVARDNDFIDEDDWDNASVLFGIPQPVIGRMVRSKWAMDPHNEVTIARMHKYRCFNRPDADNFDCSISAKTHAAEGEPTQILVEAVSALPYPAKAAPPRRGSVRDLHPRGGLAGHARSGS